jgi:hypothetical protein
MTLNRAISVTDDPTAIAQLMSQAYGDAYGNLWKQVPGAVQLPPNFTQQAAAALRQAGASEQTIRATLTKMANRRMGPSMTAQDIGQLHSDLGQLMARAKGTDPLAGEGLDQIRNALLQHTQRVASPEWAASMQQLNGQYAKWLRLQDALNSTVKGKPLTPQALQQSIGKMDDTAHKAGLLKEMEPLAHEANTASKVLAGTQERSPMERMATTGGIGPISAALWALGIPTGAAAAGGVGLGTVARVGATRPAQAALTGNLLGQRAAADAAQWIGPVVGARTSEARQRKE